MNFTDHQLELIQLTIEDYAFDLVEEHVDDLVDEYREKFPHAYIDWEKVPVA